MGAFGLVAKIAGLQAFQSAMDETGMDIDENADEKLMKLGLKVEAGAKRRCPVRTGQLRSSIFTQKISDDKVFVGSDVKYAPYVETGSGRGPAQPFLRPSLKAVKSNFDRIESEWELVK